MQNYKSSKIQRSKIAKLQQMFGGRERELAGWLGAAKCNPQMHSCTQAPGKA